MKLWVLVYLCKGLPETVEAFRYERDAKKERDKIAAKMSDEDDLVIFECELK